jgi:hypothetical protein
MLLTALVLGLIVFSTVQEYRYSRKARYSEIIGYLSEIYRDILKIIQDETANVDRIQMACRDMVTTLANAMSLVTGTRCAACIKVIVQGQRPKIVTLCRDQGSRDRDSDKKVVDHWMDANTDFEEVAKAAATPRKSFFENNLPRRREYKNTSFEVYGRPYAEAGFLSDWRRNLTWPLPYKSTIVLPIGPVHVDSDSDDQRELAGFLCVDSGARRVFARRYDEELTRGVGEALYAVIRRYTDLAWEDGK